LKEDRVSKQKPATRLCRHTNEAIYYRDQDLVNDVLGRRGFTETMFAHILGRAPAPADVDLIDAVMVALMEHGFTPSAISARLTYLGAPESLQAAVAAGLLGVGSQFVGTMENCAALLADIAGQADPADAARAIAERHRAARQPVPGFGHHLHRPDDPRALRLLALLREKGRAGRHHDALLALSQAVDASAGRHITINATGAVAVILAELGVPVRVMRGFALVARTAGLVAHLAEEQERPAASYIWDLVDHAIPFEGGPSR
jgi:citrate synthase